MIKLSANEQVIMTYVVKNMHAVKNMSIRDLARECYVSTTTIFRFVKKIGYDGFPEFVNAIASAEAETRKIHIPSVIQNDNYRDSYLKNIVEAVKVITDEKIDKFNTIMSRNPDIYVIADNCTDNTAVVAKEAGAIVYERFDTVNKTKAIIGNYDVSHQQGNIIFKSDDIKKTMKEKNAKILYGFVTIDKNKLNNRKYNYITTKINSFNPNDLNRSTPIDQYITNYFPANQNKQKHIYKLDGLSVVDEENRKMQIDVSSTDSKVKFMFIKDPINIPSNNKVDIKHKAYTIGDKYTVVTN